MYNKPAPFNIGSPELLAKSVGYSKQALAKIMQNPNSGVDPTLAVLAGMYVDRIKSGGQLAQMPTTTVKEDVLAGLEQASIPEDMFSSGVGEMPTQTYAGGGLVAFADGGEVEKRLFDDPAYLQRAIDSPYSSPERKAAAAKRLAQIKRDKLKEPGDFVGLKDTSGRAPVSRTASNPALSRGQSDNPSRATTAFQSKYNPRVGMVPGREAPKAGLEAITPEQFAVPEDKFKPPLINMNDLPLIDKQPVSELPPISARGGDGGGASASASYTPGGKPLGLNTDLKKEVEGLDKIYNEIFPETEEEKKKKEYYSDEAVHTRAAEQKKQDLWEALLHLGFNAAASDSPYWTQAWGEAGKAMAPHVSAMLKARKDEKEAVQKARQAMTQATRAKNDDTFKLASKNVSDARELEARARLEQERIKASFAETRMRIAAANKPSRDEKYVDYLAKQMIADGMDPTQAYAKASREVMRYTSGIEKYEQTQNMVSRKDAVAAWGKDMTAQSEYRKRQKKSQQDADAYKEEWLQNTMNGVTDTTASDGAWGELNIR